MLRLLSRTISAGGRRPQFEGIWAQPRENVESTTIGKLPKKCTLQPGALNKKRSKYDEELKFSWCLFSIQFYCLRLSLPWQGSLLCFIVLVCGVKVLGLRLVSSLDCPQIGRPAPNGLLDTRPSHPAPNDAPTSSFQVQEQHIFLFFR